MCVESKAGRLERERDTHTSCCCSAAYTATRMHERTGRVAGRELTESGYVTDLISLLVGGGVVVGVRAAPRERRADAL